MAKKAEVTEVVSEPIEHTQSTEIVSVEVVKGFNGLEVGAVVEVSANVASILTSKGLVK
jgi:hypothetical protein